MQSAFCGGCGSALTDLDAEPARQDLVGLQLAERYAVEAVLGQGGMGTVYRAHDVRLSRKVALKVMAPELVAHTTARRRMTQEANALARIEHGNVVRVFDVFDHEQLLVMVMELVTGGDLSKLIAPGGVPVTQAATLMEGILAGLGAIHAAGLVHRDIKPENVLLTAQGEPKVTDLGVARDSQAVQKTQLGARLGTPEYMSPEQAQGLAVDGRSDLYSAGLMLFELLTGERPFPSGSEFEVLAARVQREPDMAKLAGKCGPAVRAVVARALARHADQRFATADEFRQELTSAVQAPTAPAPSTPAAPPAVAPAAPAASVAAPSAPSPQSRPRPAAAPAAKKSGMSGGLVFLLVAVGLLFVLGAAAMIGTVVYRLSTPEEPILPHSAPYASEPAAPPPEAPAAYAPAAAPAYVPAAAPAEAPSVEMRFCAFADCAYMPATECQSPGKYKTLQGCESDKECILHDGNCDKPAKSPCTMEDSLPYACKPGEICCRYGGE